MDNDVPVEEIAYSARWLLHAVLNASPSGRPVYSSLGFADNNLMRRALT